MSHLSKSVYEAQKLHDRIITEDEYATKETTA